MTLADIRTMLRRYVSEVSPSVGVGANAALLTFINAAYDEVRNLIISVDPSFFTARTTMTYTAAAESVALPTAVGRSRIVTLADETESTTSPRELDFINHSDVYYYTRYPSRWYNPGATTSVAPDYYTLRGNQVSLIPQPAGARNLVIWYIPDKTDLSNDSDIPDVPAKHHELIAVKAAQRVLAYDRRPSASLDRTAERLEGLLMQDVSVRTSHGASFIRYTD